jgi:hypothetical protein
MLPDELFATFASKHPVARKHAIEHSSKRVHIGICINGLPENLLRRRRTVRAHAICTLPGCELTVSCPNLKHARHSEVRYEQVTILLYKDAVRREATMHDRLLVSILQHSSDLVQVATDQQRVHWPFLR